MEVLKCKMCGGELELTENSSIAKCKFCGSMQTLPRDKSDLKLNACNRANHFFRNNDYDKALGLYERMIIDDPEDANAYWSCILCKYGVEYVEDPTTHERKITVNRTQMTSVFTDDDFKMAIKYATDEQKEIFEREAREIDEIQKGIIAISSKEEPFDVFISYKETDENGERTEDSVLANQLYYGLTDAGYKVFFSKITLEDKLGSAYEPYIFAALNSAKVMIVLGTKREYFNAPWVRNEWSRFLTLTKNDPKKILIPAYLHMDPYDLPDEFAYLQSQNMQNIGFLQDIIRGIKKVIPKKKEEPAKAPVEDTAAKVAKEKTAKAKDELVGGVTKEALLKRLFMFLKDEEFNEANKYAERVLDLDPECGEAYLGKLLFDLKLREKGELGKLVKPFDTNKYYKKVMAYAPDALKKELDGYLAQVKVNMDNAKKDEILASYVAEFNTACAKKDYKSLIGIRKKLYALNGWSNSQQYITDCEKTLDDEYNFLALPVDEHLSLEKQQALIASKIKRLKPFLGYREAKEIMTKLGEQLPDAIYACAKELIDKGQQLYEAKKQLLSIKSLRDISSLYAECLEKIKEEEYQLGLKYYNLKQYNAAIEKLHDKTDYKDSEDILKKCNAEIKKAENKKKRKEFRKNHGCFFGTLKLIVLIAVLAAMITGIVYIANEHDKVNTVDIKYRKVDGGLEVAALNDTTLTSITIPSEVKGQKVIGIGENAFIWKRHLKEVTFPEGLVYIKGGAFDQCALEKIILPESIKTIQEHAFLDCKNVKTIYVPETVNTIEPGAFQGVNSIEVLTAPIEHYERFAQGSLNVLKITGNGEIPENAFDNISSLEGVVIDDGITSIGKYAFCYCGNLKSVVVPESVKIIDENAFQNTKLTSITLPAVEQIAPDAFRACEHITTVDFGESLTTIGDRAFSGCIYLRQLELPASIESIGIDAFIGCNSIFNVDLGACTKLSSIGTKAFANCGKLNKVILPPALATINGEIFNGSAVKEIVVSNGTAIINKNAFHSLDNLTTVVLPNSISKINEYAFNDCDALTELVFNANVASVESHAVNACPSVVIKVEHKLKPDLWSNEWNSSSRPVVWDYKNTDVASNGYIYTYVDGIRYAIKDNVATVVRQGKDVNNNVVIPNEIKYKDVLYPVTSIVNDAFRYNYFITSLSISGNVKTIGEYAFSSCDALETVTLAEGVDTIGKYAFAYCDVLKTLKLPTTITNCGSYAFFDSNAVEEVTGNVVVLSTAYIEQQSLKKVTFIGTGNIANSAFRAASKLETVIINEGITSVGESAFDDCVALKNLSLPHGLVAIKQYAFNNCDALVSITVPSTVKELGVGAISENDNLKEINFEDGFLMERLGENTTFYDNTALETFTVPQGVTLIPYDAFRGCTALKTVNLHEGLKQIGSGAFNGCIALENIVLPSTVAEIYHEAFMNCKALKKINIPKAVTKMQNGVFNNCEYLTIYPEVSRALSSWDKNWNIFNCQVIWGNVNPDTLAPAPDQK